MSNDEVKQVEQAAYNEGRAALNWAEKNRHWVWVAVIAALLFGGGLVTGRFALPPKTIVTEKVHETTKTDTKIVYQDRIQIVRVKDSTTSQHIHRVISEGIDPPGCKSKTTTEDIGVDTVVHDNINTVDIKYVDKIIEKWQDRIVEKTTTVASRPNWILGAGLGLDFTHIGGIGQQGIPGMKGLVVQADLDRRVIGPFYMGLWLNTELMGGLDLRVMW